MDIYLRVTEESDLDQVLTYVRAYHEFDGIAHSAINAASAVRPLLGRNTLGRVWLICHGSQPIGHIAICFGYSIEFCGRDASRLFCLVACRQGQFHLIPFLPKPMQVNPLQKKR